MNRKSLFPYFLLFGAIAATLISSCKDIIEPSITDRTITAEAPGDKFQTTSYNINFWWDDVDDALQYRLQVVTSKFDSVPGLVLDTVVKATKFSINLNPGNYQWRVRAENGSTKTNYSQAKSFTILQSSIKPQTVQLYTPANNFLTNQSSIAFSWGSLYGATQYHLEIDTANFVDESHIYYDKSIPGQQISVSLTRDQVYQWRVRAENDTAQSKWSPVYSFTFDHTPPAVVTLGAPADKQSVGSPVSLQWNSASTAIKYRLYLYKSDGVTSYAGNFPISLTTNSYSFTTGVSGDTVYWKVTAIDAAGNESAASTTRSFMIQ
ncbi:hypothetical protein [Mucilaginibacter jinjuensis]|uniref:Fibronectin type-III domain-containing protein n=1 Tax=Mucilaginibacter jinjuensis TaxID=1176721 RepID=A0ABY7TBU9_9SPHI|nr:hypothetical protein [Mucilaginibacter jinjuensis]WCT13659.1 hypothetical protein PQO05_06885 [Mucilaginibacter jinjuensis]